MVRVKLVIIFRYRHVDMVALIGGVCLRHHCHVVLLVLATRCRYCFFPLLVHVALLCFVVDLYKLADAIVVDAWPPLEVARFYCFSPCRYGWVG